jgi:5'(3')-deoxyribonucleotidase
MKRGLIDVDGVVADLMGGFEWFIREQFGMELRPREITTFRVIRSPAHQDLHQAIDLDQRLTEFLARPDCYDHSPVIDGAKDAIEVLRGYFGHELAFVTAILDESPESYATKFRWLDRNFPGIPVISCPSRQKCWVEGDYGIDDRWDTCERWMKAGVAPLLFRQPWNEAPPGARSFDWREIVDVIGSI